MDGYWLSLAVVGVLVLVNALFAGSEIAMVSLRESQLRRLERHRGGARVRALVHLVRDPNRYLASVQIGITLAGFLASATAAVSLAEPLVPLLGFLGAVFVPASGGADRSFRSGLAKGAGDFVVGVAGGWGEAASAGGVGGGAGGAAPGERRWGREIVDRDGASCGAVLLDEGVDVVDVGPDELGAGGVAARFAWLGDAGGRGGEASASGDVAHQHAVQR